MDSRSHIRKLNYREPDVFCNHKRSPFRIFTLLKPIAPKSRNWPVVICAQEWKSSSGLLYTCKHQTRYTHPSAETLLNYTFSNPKNLFIFNLIFRIIIYTMNAMSFANFSIVLLQVFRNSFKNLFKRIAAWCHSAHSWFKIHESSKGLLFAALFTPLTFILSSTGKKTAIFSPLIILVGFIAYFMIIATASRRICIFEGDFVFMPKSLRSRTGMRAAKALDEKKGSRQ